jgi:hypothetical protein
MENAFSKRFHADGGHTSHAKDETAAPQHSPDSPEKLPRARGLGFVAAA